MTTSKTTPSPLIGLIPTERIKKLNKQINRFWEMFDTRIDKDNAVNGPFKNMLKFSVLEQIIKFEDEIEGIKKERVDEGGPFVYHNPFGGIPQRVMPAKPAHHLTSKYVEFICNPKDCCGGFHRKKLWTCIRCDFKSLSVDDLRKNNGCNMFANYDTEKELRCRYLKVK
jgi:hypothetical protein